MLLRSSVVPHKSPLSHVWYMASMFLCCFGSYGVQWLFRKQLKVLEEEVSDAELTHQAELLGHDLGLKVSLAYIGNSEAARKYANVETSRSGRIVVSRKCRELLDDAEMNFMLAQSMVQSQAFRRSFLMAFLFPLPFVFIMPYFMFSHAIANHQIMLIVILMLYMGIMGGAMFGAIWSRKRTEAYVARQALKATWNLDAALSAARKLMEHNAFTAGNPQAAEAALTKQRRALERAARELGIT